MAVQLRPLHTGPGSGKALWGPGDLYAYLVTGEQSGGALFAMEGYVPNGAGPPPHIHSREDEAIYVLEGELEVQLGDEVRTASRGDLVWLPKGVPHRFTNVSGKPTRMILRSSGGDRALLRGGVRDGDDRSQDRPPPRPSSSNACWPQRHATDSSSSHPNTERRQGKSPDADGRQRPLRQFGNVA